MRGPGETVKTESAQGTGPVDAVCRAINKVVGEPGELVEFAVNAITEGIDAVGEVTIQVQEYGSRNGNGNGNGNGHSPSGKGSRIFSGYGVNTDIIVAAAEAYVAALNKLFHARQEHRRPVSVAAVAPPMAVDLFGNSVWGAPAEVRGTRYEV
jgi:2-isopropylmalate synthase